MGGSGPDPLTLESPADDSDPRRSSFRLEIAISIGYERKRTLHAGKWEGPLTSVGLLIGGLAVVLLVLWRVFQVQI